MKRRGLLETVAGESSETYAAFQRTYRDDPVAFVHDCIRWPDGEGPTAYQDEILAVLSTESRIAVRGPHGLGKTSLAAWIILWFALTRDGEDWKAPTTASVWQQLARYLWPEIHKWARALRWGKIGIEPFNPRRELLRHTLSLTTGNAFAISSGEPESIEGAHASCILYVFDEAKAIIDGIWDSAEGAFASPTTAEAFAVAISTPGDTNGRFYEIHSRRPGYEDWWVRHVTLDEAIGAGRISGEWAAQRAKQWGIESAIYKNRVLGEFAAQDEAGVIPLVWVEAANRRWEEWQDAGFPGKLSAIGADVGGGGVGGDPSAIALVYDSIKVRELRKYLVANDPRTATMEFAGRLAGIAGSVPIVVDAIGVGAGVYNRLAEQGHIAIPFVASAKTGLKDISGELGFANWRSAMWWLGREMLDPGNGFDVCLPPDEELIGELCAPQYRVVSAGRYQVEGKDKIRKRIHKSTNVADAVLQALVGPVLWAEGQEETRIVYDAQRIW